MGGCIKKEQVDQAEEFGVVLKQVEQWLEGRGLLGADRKFKLAIATDG